MINWYIHLAGIYKAISMGRLVIQIFVLYCFLMGAVTSHAQPPVVKLTTGVTESVHFMRFQGNQLLVKEVICDFLLKPGDLSSGLVTLDLPGYYATGEVGQPAFPRKSTLFEAGAGEVIRWQINQLDSVVYNLDDMGVKIQLAPFQPSQRKGRPEPEFIRDSLVYKTDTWLGSPVVSIDYEGIMRGVSMSTLHFNPVRYNPGRNQIKVYYHMECTVETAEPEKGRHIPSEAFEGLFKRIVRREAGTTKKAIFTEQPMSLVILSDTLFRETLQPFIQWKTSKGFNVVEAYRQDPAVGSSTGAIKAYLKALYEEPVGPGAPPSYLLIVGDVEHIPLSQSTGQVTDLYYTTYDGEEDYIPDLFYGRISVASADQLQHVLDKVLEYEQYQFPDPSFLDESVLIAGVDGTFASRHGNGQINYAHSYYLNASRGIQAHTFLYPGSDTSDGQILDLISEGVGFVNYTGHGLYDRWTNPTFQQNDIETLENQGKYPVMIGNGCETNLFNLGECFAEALLRAPEKGALAYIGCTNDSYWDEDYFWAVGVGPIVADPLYEETGAGYYDKVFHTHGEPYDSWAPSLGEMVFGGNISVQQSSSPRKKFYWEIYQLAGDPTLVPWFGQPAAREVQYPAMLPPDANRLDITCAAYDYVALSHNGMLLDALHASAEGYATLMWPDTIPFGELELRVSGDRYLPFSAQVLIGIPDDPFLDLVGYSLGSESVVEDGMITPEEQFSLDMQWINRGGTAIGQDTLVLFTDQSGFTLLDSMVILEGVAAGDTLYLQQVFAVRSGHQVVDQEPVMLGVYRKGDPREHKIFLKERVSAPVLVSHGITWDDRPHGNGNGIAEGGEVLVCSWVIGNMGHFRSDSIWGSEPPQGISLFEEIVFGTIPVLEPGDTSQLLFKVQLTESLEGLVQTGPFMARDLFNSLLDSVTLYVGNHFEDFSRGETDHYPFVNASVSPWVIDPSTFMSSPFSLRSGIIPDYGNSAFSVAFETTGTDTLSFAYRVSSEVGYDYLHLQVDSVQVKSWSGEKGWNHHVVVLEPGYHEVTWRYQKDQSISRGEDAAWIDDIVFPESSFRTHDLSLVEVLDPRSGPWLSDQEQIRLLVRNSGTDTIEDFVVRVRWDQQPELADTAWISLAPDEKLEYTFPATWNLSAYERFNLYTWIDVPGDHYMGNNYLIKEVDHYRYPDLSLSLIRLDEWEGVRTDAVVAIENAGNTEMDSLHFEIWLDGMLESAGTWSLGLAPGEILQGAFTLADSTGNRLTTGNYHYMIRSAATDSLDTNNEVAGVFYWHALGIHAHDLSEGVLLFPNPARDGINLLLTGPVDQDLTVELLHMNGMLAGAYKLEKGTASLYIPVTSEIPGIYLLRIHRLNLTLPLVIAR